MARVDIREYSGGCKHLVALTEIPGYGGRIWFSRPGASLLRDKIRPGTGALCLVAYEGEPKVGSVFSVPRSLRINWKRYCVAMQTGLSVEPGNLRVALPLIERLWRADDNAASRLGSAWSSTIHHPHRFNSGPKTPTRTRQLRLCVG